MPLSEQITTRLTGFADEAAERLDRQIEATRALGWSSIETRSVDGTNIHDISDSDFQVVRKKLEEAGVRVHCFGSTIANWGRKVTDPFEEDLQAARRAVSRMAVLETKLIRIMSYAVIRERSGRVAPDQMEEERFRRLRELTGIFLDAGVTPVHENCMTYGGLSHEHSRRLLQEVPGLKLVFDMANVVANHAVTDSLPAATTSAWEFYSQVKEDIVHVHIKDGKYDPDKKDLDYMFPGEGDAEVARIVHDLLSSGYGGAFSMEPHMAVVFHEKDSLANDEERFDNYVEYGRRFMRLLDSLE